MLREAATDVCAFAAFPQAHWKKMALRPDPWVTSRRSPAGEWWAEPAEVEHGEGDEGVG